MDQECLSDSDMEEALPSDPHTALQTQSNNEKHNFLEFRSGARASQKSRNNLPLTPPDVRATEQGARFLPTDHRDNARDDARTHHAHCSVGNSAVFSTQHTRCAVFFVSMLFHGACSACGKNQAIWRRTAERSVLGCCEAASFPIWEQVSRLASDPRDEARQAHEDDRENWMTTWENWPRTAYRAACNLCKGVDIEKIVMVKGDDGTHTANAEQVHALIEQAWRCMSWAHSQPGPSLKPLLVKTSLPPVNVLSMS